MRLTSLTLNRYGNYEGERIVFDPTPGRVNVLWAPNSSGKSVLRTAVSDLLFGIGNQTPMGFRYGYAGMRVTASIVDAGGTGAVFSRPKARGNPLENAAGDVLDPAFLNTILKGRDKTLLERLFVLDTVALREGGRALLETGGDVASALVSAAGGIREARGLKARLERQRDDLAPVRKTGSRPFYVHLDRFMAARSRARAETLKPDDWFRRQRDLDALEEARAARNAEAEAASAEIARVERIRRVRPWLAQRDEAIAWLMAHPEAPALAADLGQALDSARTEVTTREEAARVARETLLHADRSAEDVSVDAVLLSQGADISGLARDSGQARKARDDHTSVRGQYEHGTARIGDMLRQLGSSLQPDQAASLLPARAVLARTRQRIGEHAGIETAVRQSAATIANRTRDLADLDAALAALPVPMDVEALTRLLTEIRAGGDPSTLRTDAEKASAAAEAALAAALARVPSWSKGAEALAALSPPAADVLRRLDADVVAMRNETAAVLGRAEDAAAEHAKAVAALSALSADRPVADAEALRRARAHRETGWRLIYRRAFTDSPPVPDEEHDFDPGTPLPLAFERAIAAVDAIADERAENSDLLARIEAARRAVKDAEDRAARATERHRLSAEKLRQARRAWAQVLAPLSLTDDTALADAQAFLNARERVIDALERRALATGSLASLDRRQATWAVSLARALDVEPGPLAALAARAEQMLGAEAERRRKRNDLETQQAAAVREARDARTAHATALAEQAVWRDRWRAVLGELGRPENEEPAETTSVLEVLAEIESEHRAMTGLSRRLRGMEDDFARFRASLTATAAALPGVVLPEDPFQAVRELDRMLTAERAAEERYRVLREGLDKARISDEAAALGLAEARTRLRAVLDLIGVETIETARERLALSVERARFEALRDTADARLREAGDGFSLEALRAEIEANPVEDDLARIDAATAARKIAVEAAQRATEEATALRQSMDREARETGAIDAATDQQAAIASLSGTLDEALVYHTAALLLGRALDTVEKSGDMAMLRRLGEIFETLTCGAHARVTTELDDNEKAEFGFVQRDFPEERQSIAQLSEGTRDQFFLALRVAAIEGHLASADPLPFIGDDILQTFDDDRALAALRVLTGLSQHTQVIILTHHRHLLDLAAGLPEGTIFRCRREPLTAAA